MLPQKQNLPLQQKLFSSISSLMSILSLGLSSTLTKLPIFISSSSVLSLLDLFNSLKFNLRIWFSNSFCFSISFFNSTFYSFFEMLLWPLLFELVVELKLIFGLLFSLLFILLKWCSRMLLLSLLI